MKLIRTAVSALLLLWQLPLQAAEQQAQTLSSSPLSAVNLLQTLLGLVLVIGCIMLVAWLFKSSNRFHTSANGQMKVITGLMVGQRERLVVVQVGDEQLLLGITPQNITTLHKLEQPLSENKQSAAPGDFANKLKQMMSARGEK